MIFDKHTMYKLIGVSFICAILVNIVATYSVGSVDHSGSCTYNFQVWTPNQDIINRIQKLETRYDNMTANFKKDISELHHTLETQNFISQNITNNYEKQILRYQFDDVKLDTAIKDLKLELMENRAESGKMWAFLNQLQNTVLKNVISQTKNVIPSEHVAAVSSSSDFAFSKSSKDGNILRLIPQLKNSVGDLKAEWLLLKREVKAIKIASLQIKTNINDMEEDTMTLKSTLDLVKADVKALKEAQSYINQSYERLNHQKQPIQNSNFMTDIGEIPYDDELYDTINDLSTKYDRLKEELENISSQFFLQKDDANQQKMTTGIPELPAEPETYAGIPRDCHDVYKQGHRSSGVYQIKPDNALHLDNVYCEMLNESGWTLLHRRQDGILSFSRMWIEYKFGFGNLYGEFWLGNEMMHWLTSQKEYIIRIDMWDWEGGRAFAEYDYFHIDPEDNKYQLKIGRYTGNAGDSWSVHDEMYFSTEDSDNDTFMRNCAAEFKGGWWYHACYDSNLNGIYHTGHYAKQDNSYSDGIVWYTLKDSDTYSLKRVEMKIRPFYL